MRLLLGLLLGLLLAIAPLSLHTQFSTPLTLGYSPAQAQSAMATVTPQQLPPEARTTITLIQQGGPFPYDKDGTVFQNRERRLPEKPRGYYQEYTVPTPGSRDRGARRIVTGKGKEFYYTKDHYRTFVRIQLNPSKPKPRSALPSSAG